MTTITNPFTGEKRMAGKRQLTQKELDDAEIIEVGDRGETRPKSRGRSYGSEGDFPTDQTAAAETDINNIMRKYEKTGILEQLVQAHATGQTGLSYGDFSNPMDFQEALQITIHAEDQFNKLDAPIRNRFDNDPVKFLEFMNDPKNEEEHIKMGLRIKPPAKPKETTLEDVNNTLKAGLQPKKNSRKGVEDEE